jgi:hypothetical protein
MADELIFARMVDSEMDGRTVAMVLEQHPARDTLRETVGTPGDISSRGTSREAHPRKQLGIGFTLRRVMLAGQSSSQAPERNRQEYESRQCQPYRGVQQRPFLSGAE